MNDTTRMVGGALGVAILGSVSASGYGGHMSSAVDGLPADAAGSASDSIGGAVQVASQIGGSTGESLIAAAQDAFVTSMSEAAIVAASLALLAAFVAARFLPAREGVPDTLPAPVAEPRPA
jgi:DHA2 family multidrug resistance protein-like MFS transporter